MGGELREGLQDTLGTAYTIERELRGGGMARVFLAEEARLRRKVVVKVLTPELAEGVSAERFEREIMLAARLSHPSIVPLLTAGDAGGLPYYTMPYVEGESLRARLSAEGRLTISSAISVLRDVARALAHAHEHGIVHRDIKPENVLLAGDAAAVSDFGIAKAISNARATAVDSTLTRAGVTVGTPAYMAPEQAMGDPATDHRADIYAFGCLAYELLTGRAPFADRPAHKLILAHLGETPVDVRQLRSDCPRVLASLVMQCLAKNPAERPQSARDVLQVLEAAASGSSERAMATPLRSRRLVRLEIIAAIVGVLAFGVWKLSHRGASAAATTVEPVGALRSVAVLPFENVGGDTADAYFAVGMAEELATALSKVPGLRVVARNSSFQSGGQQVDPLEAGKALAVDALLAGSVRRAGDQMRVTARLTRVRDAALLWSDRYEERVTNVFAVQDSVTHAIVGALQVHLTSPSRAPTDSARATDRGTNDLQAYDLYLRGQFNLRRRGAGIRLAAQNFEHAIARDSNFARAYSGLSAAMELYPYFAGVPADSVFDRAMSAARHALALDSTLAEPHTSMALAYQHAYRWREAEDEYRRALAIDPNDAAAHQQFARFLTYTSRLPEAMDELQRAKALDPYSSVIATWVSNVQRLTGALDNAVAEGRRSLELDSTLAVSIAFTSLALLDAGRGTEARTMIDRLAPVIPWPGLVAYIHGATGDQGTARRIIQDLESKRPTPWFSSAALAWAYLGIADTARALSSLERATDLREIWPSFYPLIDPLFDPIRTSPRFDALVRRVGLDPVALREARAATVRKGAR